jgi:predicted TPR repeat methyltransferase
MAVEKAEALMAKGEPARAAALLRALIAEGRGGPLARITLGRAELASDDYPAALETLREACALVPGVAEAALALGEALLAAGHLPAAIGELERALRLDPGHAGAHYTLGCAWLEAGEFYRAREILAAIPQSSRVAHLAREKLGEAERMATRPRAPAGYVRHLFDQFSADYDRRMMDELSYSADDPAPLARSSLAGQAHADSRPWLRHGFGGAGFAELALRLDGVDLLRAWSRSRAARTLRRSTSRFEIVLGAPGGPTIILAADTFVYLATWVPHLRARIGALKPQGHFLFTVRRRCRDLCAAKSAATGTAKPICAEQLSMRLRDHGHDGCSPRTEANLPSRVWRWPCSG